MLDTNPILEAVDIVLGMVDRLRDKGFPITHLDLGGGLGILALGIAKEVASRSGAGGEAASLLAGFDADSVATKTGIPAETIRRIGQSAAAATSAVAMPPGIGLATQAWWLILVMAFLMGWQSCIFSPAINGSIPELYPPSYVTTANGILKVFVTVSILAGVTMVWSRNSAGDPLRQ